MLLLQLNCIERTVNIIRQRSRSLLYLSLLANPACPDMLSSLDDDLRDYARYRQVFTIFSLFAVIVCKTVTSTGPFVRHLFTMKNYVPQRRLTSSLIGFSTSLLRVNLISVLDSLISILCGV